MHLKLLENANFKDLVEKVDYYQRKPVIEIQNVVASVTLGQDLDLDSIIRLFPGVDYRPEVSSI